jgi:hypothetical protein
VAGLDETTLVLDYWNESTSEWEDAACGLYDRNPDANRLALPVCHLSQFGLFGKPYQEFLPLVSREG